MSRRCLCLEEELSTLHELLVGDACIGQVLTIEAHTQKAVATSLSLAVAVYFIVYNLGGTYMYVINGIGTIRIQLIAYVAFALMAWPLMLWACEHFGLEGIIMVPAIVMLVQAFLCKMQLHKLMNQTARGIWAK